MTDITLVVLQHGLWGKSSHMNYIEQSLTAQFKDDPTVIIVSSPETCLTQTVLTLSRLCFPSPF
jgi:hypothetical protein